MSTIRPSTRDALIDAGFAVLRVNRGASLSEVATHAGVGRATLHRHFATRDDLVTALALTAVAEIDAATSTLEETAESAFDALRQCLALLMPLGDRLSFLANESLDGNEQLLAEFDRQRDETLALVDQVKEEGGLSSQIPSAWIVRVIDYLLFAAWESIQSGELTVSQATDLVWTTLMQGAGVTHER